MSLKTILQPFLEKIDGKNLTSPIPKRKSILKTNSMKTFLPNIKNSKRMILEGIIGQ